MGIIIFLVIIFGIGKLITSVTNSTPQKRDQDVKMPWD